MLVSLFNTATSKSQNFNFLDTILLNIANALGNLVVCRANKDISNDAIDILEKLARYNDPKIQFTALWAINHAKKQIEKEESIKSIAFIVAEVERDSKPLDDDDDEGGVGETLDDKVEVKLDEKKENARS